MSLGRWLVKKAARYCCVAGSSVRAVASAPRTPMVHALMYHRIRRAPRDPFSVTPEAFAAQMGWLAEQGLAVGLETVADVVQGTRRLERNAVLVTLDDGSPDWITEALPTLKRYRIPAVAFVTVGRVEERGGGQRSEAGDEVFLSWREIEALAAGGVTIASHGWDHVSLAGLEQSAMREQAERSRTVLQQRLGQSVAAFAYPFGTRRDFNTTTARILKEAGYRLVFTAQHGAIVPGTDPFALPRVKIEGGEGMWMFRRIAVGRLDGWTLVDRLLWGLQASEGRCVGL
ncbi:MAG: polysaccharide deacetylase family protein [Candidatus Binatia bacterium]